MNFSKSSSVKCSPLPSSSTISVSDPFPPSVRLHVEFANAQAPGEKSQPVRETGIFWAKRTLPELGAMPYAIYLVFPAKCNEHARPAAVYRGSPEP
jgi:hypothetical protein